MATFCRGCKREISPGQPSCHVCGAPQGLLSFYRKNIVTVVLITGAFAAFGYWYLDNSIKQIEANKTQLNLAKTEQAQESVQQLEEQLKQINKMLEQSHSETAQVQEKLQQANDSINALQAQLTDSQNKAVEADKRASWLSKVNKQLKLQVDERSTGNHITPQTNSLETNQPNSSVNSSVNSPVNSQLESLNQELSGYQSQKQTLLNNIASKKSQLEQSWQSSSEGSSSVDSTVLTARAAQIEDATKVEREQLEQLNKNIEKVLSQINGQGH